MTIDIDKIKEVALRLKKDTENMKMRQFVSQIEIASEPRIKVIRGFRGLGKTTALLQLMNEKSIYFSMDQPYVSEFTLYEIGLECIQNGYKTLLIDEIQYYPKWKRDTKALYDEFKDVKIVVSGSAAIAFEPERRYKIIDVEPLSLTEFIELDKFRTDIIYEAKETIRTDAWLDKQKTIEFLAKNYFIHEKYNEYMKGGSFPASKVYKDEILDSIYNSIQKSIRDDAPFFSKIDGEEIRGMERLLVFLASSALGELSIHSLTKHLSLKKHRVEKIIELLKSMRILRLIRPYGQGSTKIRGESKLMFYHPVLRSAICHQLKENANIGAIREELAVFSFFGRGWQVYTIKGMKRNPDYMIQKADEKIVVEIGGENKSGAQLKGFKEKTLLITERQLITLSLF